MQAAGLLGMHLREGAMRGEVPGLRGAQMMRRRGWPAQHAQTLPEQLYGPGLPHARRQTHEPRYAAPNSLGSARESFRRCRPVQDQTQQHARVAQPQIDPGERHLERQERPQRCCSAVQGRRQDATARCVHDLVTAGGEQAQPTRSIDHQFGPHAVVGEGLCAHDR
jgi:hypothetical protein